MAEIQGEMVNEQVIEKVQKFMRDGCSCALGAKSDDSAFSLASILLTSDFVRRACVSTNLVLVLSRRVSFHGYKYNWH